MRSGSASLRAVASYLVAHPVALLPALAVFVATVLAEAPAGATQVVERSIEQLGDDANRVVQGRVTERRAFWNADGTRILTEVEIDVDRDWKGTGSSRVTVLQMGGTVGTVRMTVHGSVQWTEGDEVLVFLEPSLPDRYRVSGFHQGKFDVERDTASGEIHLSRGVLEDGRLATTGPQKSAASGDGRWTIDEVLGRAGIRIEEGR